MAQDSKCLLARETSILETAESQSHMNTNALIMISTG